MNESELELALSLARVSGGEDCKVLEMLRGSGAYWVSRNYPGASESEAEELVEAYVDGFFSE